MLREFITITLLLTLNGHWDELREFFALYRKSLENTTHLSPEDQAKMNSIFEKASAITTKETAELSQK